MDIPYYLTSIANAKWRRFNIALYFEYVTNTCKRMQNSSIIPGFLQCNAGKMEEAEDFKCDFVVVFATFG